MKGLLLKDFYMAKKYCRFFLLLIVLFCVLPFTSSKENLFLVFYPNMLAAILPTTLLGYDERSKWDRYSAVFPYTSAQIVSSKYLFGLSMQLIVLLMTGISQFVNLSQNGLFHFDSYLSLMITTACVSLLAPTFIHPPIFKMGVEKGRMVFILVIGLFTVIAMLTADLFSGQDLPQISFGYTPILVAVISLALYALSWYLSIVFYSKREM